MTDEERDVAFASIKANVIDMILGSSSTKTEVDEVEKREVDNRFDNDTSWLEQPRLTGNNDNTGWDVINQRMHDNNGHLDLGKRFAPRHRAKKIRWTPAVPES